MASTAQPIYRTDVFACQNQRLITTSGSTQRADVFARRERRAAGIALPEPHRLTVRLSIDGDPVEFEVGVGPQHIAGLRRLVEQSTVEDATRLQGSSGTPRPRPVRLRAC